MRIKMEINYLQGDATVPNTTEGLRIIAHICNNKGGWARGFVVAISKKWPKPEARYRELFDKSKHVLLGTTQMVPVRDEHGTIFVANMIAQNGYVSSKNPVAVSYSALKSCYQDLNHWIRSYNAVQRLIKLPNYVANTSIHMPRIGCGLGGGTWSEVEAIIKDNTAWGTAVNVYDLPSRS